jgi:hypothetical protein
MAAADRWNNGQDNIGRAPTVPILDGVSAENAIGETAVRD